MIKVFSRWVDGERLNQRLLIFILMLLFPVSRSVAGVRASRYHTPDYFTQSCVCLTCLWLTAWMATLNDCVYCIYQLNVLGLCSQSVLYFVADKFWKINLSNRNELNLWGHLENTFIMFFWVHLNISRIVLFLHFVVKKSLLNKPHNLGCHWGI